MAEHGGVRKGAGRKAGKPNTVSNLAREKYAESGLLPHEFLLMVARGEPIKHTLQAEDGNISEVEVYPSLEWRIDAAKAAANYFAPKLAIQSVSVERKNELSIDFGGLTAEQLEAIGRGILPAGETYAIDDEENDDD